MGTWFEFVFHLSLVLYSVPGNWIWGVFNDLDYIFAAFMLVFINSTVMTIVYCSIIFEPFFFFGFIPPTNANGTFYRT